MFFCFFMINVARWWWVFWREASYFVEFETVVLRRGGEDSRLPQVHRRGGACSASKEIVEGSRC